MQEFTVVAIVRPRDVQWNDEGSVLGRPSAWTGWTRRRRTTPAPRSSSPSRGAAASGWMTWPWSRSSRASYGRRFPSARRGEAGREGGPRRRPDDGQRKAVHGQAPLLHHGVAAPDAVPSRDQRAGRRRRPVRQEDTDRRGQVLRVARSPAGPRGRAGPAKGD